MTLLRSLIAFLAITLIIFVSCKKDYSNEDGKVPGQTETTWEFDEAGTHFNGDMDSAYYQTSAGFSALTMVGSPGNQNGEIILQIIGQDITTGTYASSDIFFQYSEGGNILYQTIPGQSSDFSITITSIDTATVTGTFSGTVVDPSNVSHNIQNGQFTVSMTQGYTPGPPQDGQLTVWAKQICFDGSSIEVKVQDQTGFISDAIDSDPGCGAQGAATFTLPQGFYTVTAICGTDTLRYDVNLSSACVKLLVDFVHPPLVEDYLPLTAGSYWDYVDLLNQGTTQRTAVASDTVIDGRLYTMEINTLPDTVYYRKDGHVYYQYRLLDFNSSVQDPVAIEVEILHDDYQTNQTWETPPVDVNLSGINVKLKLVSTILRRDYSESINGINYDNLIEVNTEIFFSPNGGVSYQSTGSSYNTVFSKGKGIVYYYDLDNSIEWAAYNISVVP
jgi:hypothetical protein